jgi:hypothetical protein
LLERDERPDPHAILGADFFDAFDDMDWAAKQGLGADDLPVKAAIDTLASQVTDLRVHLEKRTGFTDFTGSTKRADVERYVSHHKTWFDELRLFSGRWSSPGDVKLIVELSPGMIHVDLTKWLASQAQVNRFSDYLRRPDREVRQRLAKLSSDLLPFGLSVELVFSRNYGQRRLIDADLEWYEWCEDPNGQATARVALWRGVDVERAINSARQAADARRAQSVAAGAVGNLELEELGRILPGAAGLEWIKRGQDGDAVTLEEAAEQAGDQVARGWDRLIDGGLMEEAVLTASAGFAEILAPLHEHERRRLKLKLLGANDPVPAFDAPTAEIAAVMKQWALKADSRLGQAMAPNSSEGLVVTVKSAHRATLGWGARKDLPRIDISRQHGVLHLDFILDHQPARSGKDEPRAWRRSIAYGTAGLVGESLVARALRDPALSFHCKKHPASGANGGCPIAGTDALRRHWIWAAGAPTMRWSWSAATVVGRSRTWLREPGLFFGSLLAQVLSDGRTAPALLVPEEEKQTFDAFVSFRGSTGKAVASALRVALGERGYDVWHMDDWQTAGKNVVGNNEAGVASSRAFIPLLSSDYWASSFCCKEFIAAVEFDVKMIPMTLLASGSDVRDGIVQAGVEQPGEAKRALAALGASEAVLLEADELYKKNRPGVTGVDDVATALPAVTNAFPLGAVETGAARRGKKR